MSVILQSNLELDSQIVNNSIITCSGHSPNSPLLFHHSREFTQILPLPALVVPLLIALSRSLLGDSVPMGPAGCMRGLT